MMVTNESQVSVFCLNKYKEANNGKTRLWMEATYVGQPRYSGGVYVCWIISTPDPKGPW
jgi:hypothetical protein